MVTQLLVKGNILHPKAVFKYESPLHKSCLEKGPFAKTDAPGVLQTLAHNKNSPPSPLHSHTLIRGQVLELQERFWSGLKSINRVH